MTRLRTRTCSNEETVDPQSDLGWLLVTGRNRLLARIDQVLAPLDLTAAQCGVLLGIERFDANTPAALCELLDYDRGAMTRLLDRLEAKGLLQRRPNPHDRRAVVLELTPKGQALCPQVQPRIDSVFAQALRGLEPEQAKTLVSLLCRVVLNLE
ncbi:MAG: MarR family transcriptional regulator [Xanthomonadaceae bacterium]|nr:MarR family transcriptional regulator [Xanthomonadaceae bacterium]